MTGSDEASGGAGEFADRRRGGGLVIPFRSHTPELAPDVYLAPTSVVIGRAKLGPGVGVWFGTVVRADIARIEIGEGTNIQDICLLHVGEEFPCIVGRRCVVGHRAILHGTRVGDRCLIGMGAVLLNGSEIGEGSVIAAGALVPEGKVIPPRSLVMGSPGRVVREVSDKQIESTLFFADKYAKLGAEYVRDVFGGGQRA